MPFHASRLQLARLRRSLSGAELGARVGVDQRTIVNYESGTTRPDAETTERLAAALGFPANFFDGEPVFLPATNSAHFRAATRMRAPERDAALAAGGLAVLFSKWMDQHFRLPQNSLPELVESIDPEAAAIAVRSAWGLGDRPIPNMVHLLELHGVRVFSLIGEATSVDAFSLYAEDRPLVFIDTTKSAERCRFDAAHELAHLLLHDAQAGRSREQEAEANAFASAFLMPASSVRAIGRVPIGIDELNALKAHWRIAVSAFVLRLQRLRMLSDWHYRMLNIEIAKRGWRQSEPEPKCAYETSQVLRKTLHVLRERHSGLRSVAAELAIPYRDLQGLVAGLVPVAR